MAIESKIQRSSFLQKFLEYYSFEKDLTELQLSEKILKKLNFDLEGIRINIADANENDTVVFCWLIFSRHENPFEFHVLYRILIDSAIKLETFIKEEQDICNDIKENMKVETFWSRFFFKGIK